MAAEHARTDPWLVVGLGNPGSKYAGNRHNVGAMVLDVLAQRGQASWSTDRRSKARTAEVRLGSLPGVRLTLAQPQSFMNTSGAPVQRLCAYQNVPAAGLVVIHDELDLPFGAIRLKFGGGDNGHNGLKSVRQALGTGDYYRVRMGIGRPTDRQPPADYVLRDYSPAERKALPDQLMDAAEAVEMLVLQGLSQAQNAYHGRV